MAETHRMAQLTPRCPYCGETRLIEPVKLYGRPKRLKLIGYVCTVCARTWPAKVES